LALLIEWLREGKARNVTLRYENIPARMLPVAQACGVTALIPEEWFQTADLGLEVAQ
jgi:ABC-type transporter Mla MlaB component